MNKIERLLEGIRTDSNGGVRIKFLEGDKLEVSVYDEPVEIVELEKGDEVQDCLSTILTDMDVLA